MSKQKTGAIRTIWLHVLTEGGYSTVAEVAEAVGRDRKITDKMLAYLASSGFCSRFENPDRKNGIGYGVTADCKVPNGVLVKDIVAAAGLIVDDTNDTRRAA